MRKCLIKARLVEPIVTTDPTDRYITTTHYQEDFETKGLFHQWGTSAVENGETMAMYTIGVVELEDGTIAEVIPERIKFEPVVNSVDLKKLIDEAYKECSHNAYFGNGYKMGFDKACEMLKTGQISI